MLFIRLSNTKSTQENVTVSVTCQEYKKFDSPVRKCHFLPSKKDVSRRRQAVVNKNRPSTNRESAEVFHNITQVCVHRQRPGSL